MQGNVSTGEAHGDLSGLTKRELSDLSEMLLSIDAGTTGAEVQTVEDHLPPRVVRVEPASLTRVDVWFSEAVDRTTAEDLGNWRIVGDDGVDAPIASAEWSAQNGDR